MKKLLKIFETAMTAVAFAEEGEFETARQVMRDEEKKESSGAGKSPAGTKLIRAN